VIASPAESIRQLTFEALVSANFRSYFVAKDERKKPHSYDRYGAAQAKSSSNSLRLVSEPGFEPGEKQRPLALVTGLIGGPGLEPSADSDGCHPSQVSQCSCSCLTKLCDSCDGWHSSIFSVPSATPTKPTSCWTALSPSDLILTCFWPRKRVDDRTWVPHGCHVQNGPLDLCLGWVTRIARLQCCIAERQHARAYFETRY